MVTMIDHNFFREAAEALRDLACRVEGADVDEKKTIALKISSINGKLTDKVYHELLKWEGQNKDSRFVYTIEASKDTNLEECYQKFSSAKARKFDNRAYARLNEISPVFYVGSSRSLGKRIKEHLGFGPRGTYALQLVYWATDISGELYLTIWRFPEKLGQDVSQAIEDWLWTKCKPMFGRQGPR